MAKNMIKQIHFWITFFVGVSFAYFVWLTWDKLTEWIGNSNWVWGITAGIVVIAMFTGYLSFKKIVERFT